MTDLPSVSEPAAPTARIHTLGGAAWMLVAAPFLIAAGAFVTVAMQPFVNTVSAKGDAVLMAWVGAVLLCLGVACLIAGLTLLGVRSIVQQQTELLRGALPRAARRRMTVADA